MAIERVEVLENGWFSWLNENIRSFPNACLNGVKVVKEVFEPHFTDLVNAGTSSAAIAQMMLQIVHSLEQDELNALAQYPVYAYYATGSIGMFMSLLRAYCGEKYASVSRVTNFWDKTVNFALYWQFFTQGVLYTAGKVFQYTAPNSSLQGPYLFIGLALFTAAGSLPSWFKADPSKLEEIETEIDLLLSDVEGGERESAMTTMLTQYHALTAEIHREVNTLLGTIDTQGLDAEQTQRQTAKLLNTIKIRLDALSPNEKNCLLECVDNWSEGFTKSKAGKVYVIAESAVDFGSVTLAVLQTLTPLIKVPPGSPADITIDVVTAFLSILAGAIGAKTEKAVQDTQGQFTKGTKRHSAEVANSYIEMGSALVTIVNLLQMVAQNENSLTATPANVSVLSAFVALQGVVAGIGYYLENFYHSREAHTQLDEEAAPLLGNEHGSVGSNNSFWPSPMRTARPNFADNMSINQTDGSDSHSEEDPGETDPLVSQQGLINAGERRTF